MTHPGISAVALWVIVLVAAGLCRGAATPDGGAQSRPTEALRDRSIRGITLAPIEDARLGPVGYGSKTCREALVEIADLGADWISITPFGRMDDLTSIDIRHDFEIPAPRNEQLIRTTIAQAADLGLRTALIPHLYVMSGEWRGRIDPGSEAGMAAWFDAYEQFVLRFARLAETAGADLFSIGVEFKSTTNRYEARWRRLIRNVRAVYSGLVTYSANWDEMEYVQFWDDLDLIGINAFWPLAQSPGDGYPTMGRAARRIADELGAFAHYWNKPILFTEFGIKSARDAALAPWEWPEHMGNLQYDEVYQAEAYEAVLEVMTGEPWFSGLFIWKYFTDSQDETQEPQTGFSPRGKLAEQVLSSYYARRWD